MKKIKVFVVLTSLILFSIQIWAQTWSSAKQLTWTPGMSFSPKIAVDSADNLHFVWREDKSGNYEIFYKKSTDGGSTWSAPVRLTWGPEQSKNPLIAADSGSNIYVFWINSDTTYVRGDLYFRKSTDQGETWLPTNRITWIKSYEFPAVTLDENDNIYLSCVTSDPPYLGGDNELFLKKSTDGGASWFPRTKLTWNSGLSWGPDIETDSNNFIHLTWIDNTPGNIEIFYKQSTDGGAGWSKPQRLTWNPGDSYNPKIATDSNNNVFVVWYDDMYGQNEVFFKKSTDEGLTWGATQRLTWNNRLDDLPQIAVDSLDTLHVVWRGYHSPGYKQSTDQGSNWTPNEDLHVEEVNSLDLTIDSYDALHLIWHSIFTGDWEIYYMNRK